MNSAEGFALQCFHYYSVSSCTFRHETGRELALAVPYHGLERSFRFLLASGIQGPPPAASKQHAGKAELTGTGLGFQHVTENESRDEGKTAERTTAAGLFDGV